MCIALSFLDSGGFLAGSAFGLSPTFLIKVNCVLHAFGHTKTKDKTIFALGVYKQEESTFYQILPKHGICIGGTYTGFMCIHCLRAGSKCGIAPHRKETTAYNIQLVTITQIGRAHV